MTTKISAMIAATALTDDMLFETVYAPGGAATSKKITAAQLKLYLGSPYTYNVMAAPYLAANNGTTDDTTAIAAAIADASIAVTAGLNSVVLFPQGPGYKTTSQLTVDIGSGEGSIGPQASLILRGTPCGSIIKPSSAVSGACLDVRSHTSVGSQQNYFLLDGLVLDGTNTAAGGIIGLDCGNNISGTLYNNYRMRDTVIQNFFGAAGIGLRIVNVVNFHAIDCKVHLNGDDLVIQGTDTNLPTAMTFDKCDFRTATRNGVKIVRGYKPVFNGCVIESNTLEGVTILPGATDNATEVVFDKCWIEANYASDATKYQLRASGIGAAGCSLSLRDCNMNGASRSLSLSTVSNLVITGVVTRATANSVVIDSCNGSIVDWPENNVSFATAVTITNVTNTNNIGPALPPALTDRRFGTTYGVNVAIDLVKGRLQQVQPNNGTAFQIDNPTNLTLNVMPFIILLKNVTGGALGAVTMGTKYKTSAAITAPATGFNRSYCFQYDPASLNIYELWRSTADIAN